MFIADIERLGLTEKEAKFIHGMDCKILPFHANINDAQVNVSGDKGVEKGKAHAKAALSAARGLKIPTGVYIYCNIEPHWSPTVDFMLGWWETFANSEYLGGGGFYCGPSAFPIFEAAVAEAKNRFGGGNVFATTGFVGDERQCGQAPRRIQRAQAADPAAPGARLAVQPQPGHKVLRVRQECNDFAGDRYDVVDFCAVV